MHLTCRLGYSLHTPASPIHRPQQTLRDENNCRARHPAPGRFGGSIPIGICGMRIRTSKPRAPIGPYPFSRYAALS